MSGLSLTIVRSFAGLQELRHDWETLEKACDGALLFQSYKWCWLVASVTLPEEDENLFICTVYRGKTLIGLLPLRFLKKRYHTVLTGLSEPFQEFTDMLVAPGNSPVAIFNEMLPALKGCGADCLHFGQVREDARLFDAIERQIPAVGERDAAPFVALDQWDSFETYLQSVKSKTRKNMRNQRNGLERTAKLRHAVTTGGEKLDQIIERTYANRARWLVEKGLTSAAFSDDHFQSFLAQFKSGPESGIDTLGMSFRHGDKFLSEQWGFVHRGRYYAFVSSYNEDYARLSPGKLHLGEVIKTGFDLKLKTMEFMLPDVPYKRTWAAEVIPVQDHILGLTGKGKLYAGLWVSRLRPVIKKSILLMPDFLRRGLMRVLRQV